MVMASAVCASVIRSKCNYEYESVGGECFIFRRKKRRQQGATHCTCWKFQTRNGICYIYQQMITINMSTARKHECSLIAWPPTETKKNRTKLKTENEKRRMKNGKIWNRRLRWTCFVILQTNKMKSWCVVWCGVVWFGVKWHDSSLCFCFILNMYVSRTHG